LYVFLKKSRDLDPVVARRIPFGATDALCRGARSRPGWLVAVLWVPVLLFLTHVEGDVMMKWFTCRKWVVLAVTGGSLFAAGGCLPDGYWSQFLAGGISSAGSSVASALTLKLFGL
jgi:hypothetical protein